MHACVRACVRVCVLTGRLFTSGLAGGVGGWGPRVHKALSVGLDPASLLSPTCKKTTDI